MNTSISEDDDAERETYGGQPSYSGFEYQILASVWLTLEIQLTKGARSVQIEPISSEDLAASFEVKGEVATSMVTEDLEVQIKMRNGSLWSLTDLKPLLFDREKRGTKGPDPRSRALAYLESNSCLKYLIVTNAPLDRRLESLGVKNIGDYSNPLLEPALLRDWGDAWSQLGHDVRRRIGIIAGHSFELLEAKIQKILQSKCHLPGQNVDRCLGELKKLISDRMSGGEPIRLRRRDVEKTIERHGGSFSLSKEPILPVNFGELRDKLRKQFAVVIIGPPGTGKTELANHLINELQCDDPPALVIKVMRPEGLIEIRSTIDGDNATVYFIEDPWGQGPPNENADYMAKEIPKLMRMARPGKTFIVTSPIAAFKEVMSPGDSMYDAWLFELHPKDYSRNAYEQIYDRAIASWNANMRSRGKLARDVALENLETPYAVTVFCEQLKNLVASGHVPTSHIEGLAKSCNVNTLGSVLRRRIQQGGARDVQSAIAVWAVLHIGGNIAKTEEVRAVRKRIREGGAVPPDVERFFNYLVASHWLQSRAEGYLATPSVRIALAEYAKSDPGEYEYVMSALLNGWALEGEFDRMIVCYRANRELSSCLRSDLWQKIDMYLVSIAIGSARQDFRYRLHDLTQYSNDTLLVGVLAKALTTKDTRNQHLWRLSNVPVWVDPNLSNETVSKMANDNECRELMARFIVDYLPGEVGILHFLDTYRVEDLVPFVARFGWPANDLFEQAFREAVCEYKECAPTMLKYLMKVDQTKVDSAIAHGVAALVSLKQRYAGQLDYDSSNEQQGETDADHSEWSHPFYDDREVISQVFEVAIECKNTIKGFNWIVAHDCLDDMIDSWASVLKRRGSMEECAAFVECCERRSGERLASSVIAKRLNPIFYEWAVEQISKENHTFGADLRHIICEFAKDREFTDLIVAKAGDRRSQVLCLVVYLIFDCYSDSDLEYLEIEMRVKDCYAHLFQVLDETQVRVAVCCTGVERLKKAFGLEELRDAGVTLLEKLVLVWPEDIGVKALLALAYLNISVSATAKLFLESKDALVRRIAWRACFNDRSLLATALLDADYNCRIEALQLLAENATNSEWEKLLELRNDSSAFVRFQLTTQIGGWRLRSGVDALFELLKDSREYGDARDEDDRHYFKVARGAAAALFEIHQVEKIDCFHILAFLEDCEQSSRDARVHEILFGVISFFPSVKTMEFCNRYVSELWLRSRWKDFRGYVVLERCIEAMLLMVDKKPEIGSYVDLTPFGDVFGWEDDEGWLVASVTALVGITAPSNSGSLSRLINKDVMNEARARLLALIVPAEHGIQALSSKGYFAAGDGFKEFILWTPNDDVPDLPAFELKYPEFANWRQTLDRERVLRGYLKWALQRKINRSINSTQNLWPPGFSAINELSTR